MKHPILKLIPLPFLFAACSQADKKEQCPSGPIQEMAASAQLTTLASGLRYETLQEAGQNSLSPASGQRVAIHYTGWFDEGSGTKGKQFDSSAGQDPFVFNIDKGVVIRGFDEGVMSMKVGEKRRFYIPADLAYGTMGAGNGLIPPDAPLIFEVELLGLS